MKRISISIIVAVLTFIIGVGISSALVMRTSPDVPPIVGPEDLLIAEQPSRRAAEPVLEMVFVLDTTGSMSGLLEGAKQKIWSIVNETMQKGSRPAVRIGLVAYRDLGDAYVTQVTPLTEDLDRVYATLMQYRAEGGGDGPENVRRALADAVNKAGWSQRASNVAQIIFLVGDAPPHDDYQNEPSAAATTDKATRSGMIVNTIQCGNQIDTRTAWQEIARRGQGQYFAIAQDGGVETISTPYDTRLSELGTKLGSTFMAYGGGSGTAGRLHRSEMAERQASIESRVSFAAPASASADRAVNKALNAKAYIGDLLQSLENGSAKLESIKEEDLPDDLRKLTPEARQQEVNKRLEERRKLRDEIASLAKQRDDFIVAERKRRDASGKQAGFDTAVSAALKEQLARKGIK